MIICLGPVCVPLHLLLPFLLALLHKRGHLQWLKEDWVTLTWWLALFRRLLGKEPKEAVAPGGKNDTKQKTAAGESGAVAEGLTASVEDENAGGQAGLGQHGKKDS